MRSQGFAMFRERNGIYEDMPDSKTLPLFICDALRLEIFTDGFFVFFIIRTMRRVFAELCSFLGKL